MKDEVERWTARGEARRHQAGLMDMIFKKNGLTRAIEAVVAAGGSEPAKRKLVAENLVMANLLGHDSHGIGMIPRYIDSVLEGGLRAEPASEGEDRHGRAARARRLQGLWPGRSASEAMRDGHRAREKARQLRDDRSATRTTSGASGSGREQAVAEGLVSIHFVNVISHARVAPYGGADARFGTNPVCIGIPLPGEPPFVLDMATSAVAQGKIRVAHNKGEKVPRGWLIDTEGNPTDDPRYGVVDAAFGAMRTFGGHKGYGLALACELLGGALTGGGTGTTRRRSKQRVLNGMLAIVIDPARIGTRRCSSKRDARVPRLRCASRRRRPASIKRAHRRRARARNARQARARWHSGRREHLEGNPAPPPPR